MADQYIDARADLNPIPILQAGAALRAAEDGQSVELVTAGFRMEADVLAWVEDMGFDLKETVRDPDGSTHFVIVK